jgi:hypothetical protein
MKTTAQLERELEPNQVLVFLRAKLKEFEGTMPIVEALKNNDLKTHHWMKISEIISGIEKNLSYNNELNSFQFINHVLSNVFCIHSIQARLHHGKRPIRWDGC